MKKGGNKLAAPPPLLSGDSTREPRDDHHRRLQFSAEGVCVCSFCQRGVNSTAVPYVIPMPYTAYRGGGEEKVPP